MPESQAKKVAALTPKKRAATVRRLNKPTPPHTLYNAAGCTEHHTTARIEGRERAPTTTPVE
jgi:hypothetical protein